MIGKEIDYSWKLEDANVMLDSTKSNLIIQDVLKNSTSSIFVADMDKAKGTQSYTNKRNNTHKGIHEKSSLPQTSLKRNYVFRNGVLTRHGHEFDEEALSYG